MGVAWKELTPEGLVPLNIRRVAELLPVPPLPGAAAHGTGTLCFSAITQSA